MSGPGSTATLGCVLCASSGAKQLQTQRENRTGKSACATGAGPPTLEIKQQIALDKILYICRL